MEKQIVKVGRYTFEEHEARIALHCLDYVAGKFSEKKAKRLKEWVREPQLEKLRTTLREMIGKEEHPL